jgi:hypothetical protein
MSLYTEGTYLGVGNWVPQNSARTSRRLVVVAFSPAQSRAGARVLLVADPQLPLPQAWLWYLALLSFSLLSPVSLVHALSLSLSRCLQHKTTRMHTTDSLAKSANRAFRQGLGITYGFTNATQCSLNPMIFWLVLKLEISYRVITIS